MKELKPRVEKILIFSGSFLISIVVIFIFLHILKASFKVNNNIAVIIAAVISFLLFIAVLGPPLILSATYLYTDLTKKVFIDENKKEIRIKKRGEKFIITNNDIVKSFYVCVATKRGHNYKYPFYKYVLLILKENKRVYITNLLCEPELIIDHLNLNFKLIDINIPFISKLIGDDIRTSNAFENKVQEFEENFKNYSNEKLATIITQKNTYTDYAREAASRILKKRKQNNDIQHT